MPDSIEAGINSFKNDCDSIQFFSLHPKSTDRIENLKAFDPKTSQLFNMFRGAITIIVAAGYFTALYKLDICGFTSACWDLYWFLQPFIKRILIVMPF